ncbi:MAG: alanine racemase [Candidatus Lokiarchaeota archaeon]|nr:alanine racemase [Candidatus Lokiarchaeota archaeon]
MKKISGNPYLRYNKKDILIDLVNLDDLLEKYQTPFMVFIENRIRDNIKTFNRVFNEHFDRFEGYYSIKANYLHSICNTIKEENFGVEIISLPELKLCQDIGFKHDKIIMGGPYLPNNLIIESLQKSLKEIIVYDLKDIERIDLLAKKFDKVQNICLRINSMRYESKLGIEINHDNIKYLIKILEKCQNIKISTILSHYGSQMNNVDQYIQNLKNIIISLKNLRKNGIEIKNINLGGGFPEATVMPEHQLELIAKEIKNYLISHQIDYDKIIFEPGRYLVGDSGIFIAKIIKITDKRWIFINLGNHICPKFARCSLRFYNINEIDSAHKYKTFIAGIMPTDQDVLAKNYFFTKDLRYGDKILITNVGAYCLTFSNRFPYALPHILSVKNTEIKEIFNPEKDNDFSLN